MRETSGGTESSDSPRPRADEGVMTPRSYVEYYTSCRGIGVDDVGVAPIVVLSWGERVIKSLADSLCAKRCPNWFYDDEHIVYPLYRATISDAQISFAQVPEGAPATVMMMEEMIACGARIFLSLGWAGSLQKSAPVGTILIPTSCLREEGTSSHYLPSGEACSPDPGLSQIMIQAAGTEGCDVVTGPVWTTDAPYRELPEKVLEYQRNGVVGVDMESSAMLSLGVFRKVRVCNLLVISDEIWGGWNPAFRSAELREATVRAERVIIRCLKAYLESTKAMEESETMDKET